MSDDKDKDGGDDKDKAGDGGSDSNVTITKEKLDNLTKARDEERSLRKESDAKLATYEKSAEDKKAESERKKAEDKGEYDKILSEKDKEIEKYKPHSERLDKLLKDAEESNKKDLEKFEDDGQKKLIENAIKGKDHLDARKLIKEFSDQFLGKKKENSDVGNGIHGNPADKKVKLDKIEVLNKEFEALGKKRSGGGMFNAAEKKRLTEIPAELKKLKSETEDKK